MKPKGRLSCIHNCAQDIFPAGIILGPGFSLVLQFVRKCGQFSASLMLAIALVLSGPAMAEVVCPAGHGSHADHHEHRHSLSAGHSASHKSYGTARGDIHRHDEMGADRIDGQNHTFPAHSEERDTFCAQYCGCGDTQSLFLTLRKDGQDYTFPNTWQPDQLYGSLFPQNEFRIESYAQRIMQQGSVLWLAVGHPYKYHYARTMRALT